MGYRVEISNLNYTVNRERRILSDINATVAAGSFVAVLGENGAGKTTLLDLTMGFRVPSAGILKVDGDQPHLDNWEKRQHIAYLSEKVDIPGDWSARDFFEFNRFFYKNYSVESETQLVHEFRVDTKNRLGNMSAGEIRRVQAAAALSILPRLVVVDEITAVLDIVGRRKFMKILSDQNRTAQCTVVLATNILEDLANHITHVLLIHRGEIRSFQPLTDFLKGADRSTFSEVVADILESQT